MIDLAGLTPVGVRCSGNGLHLRWQTENRTFELDFERFRPIKLRKLPGVRSLRVTWRDFGDLPMSDLFFKATLEQAEKLPYRSELFETDGDVLDYLADQPGNLPFSGAIFHMARTGSTLVHRLLSRTGKLLSLSEVALIDRALFLTAGWPEADRNAALRGVVSAFARPRRPNERNLVIKMTDAMPNTRIHRFRQAFPRVPWIFIYRHPVEVMVSMLRGPTGNLHNWYKNRAQVAERLRMPALRDGAMWPEEFMARTLARFCSRAVQAARATQPGLFLAVAYPRLPDAVWETIAPHFGLSLSEREREAMRAESRYSAKRADIAEFKSDSGSKREEATPRVLALAEQFVRPVFEQLKALPQG